MEYPINIFTNNKLYFICVNVIKSEQECFIDEKLCVCVYIGIGSYVANKNGQFVIKQLPAGVFSYFICTYVDTALA